MIVAFTVSCAREKYLRETLDSWTRARGSRECKMVFALEPPGSQFPVEAFSEFARRSFPAGVSVHPAPRPLHCLANTRRAMELALQQEDFGAVAEEDLEVADDVLEYLAWASEAYREDKNVVAVCAHARASQLSDSAAVVRAPWFNPLVWGTWRDRWTEVIAPQWQAADWSGNRESWDLQLMTTVSTRGLHSVFPVRSRSVHRGEVSTQYTYELGRAFWPSSISDCYAPHYEPQAYREVLYPVGKLVV